MEWNNWNNFINFYILCGVKSIIPLELFSANLNDTVSLCSSIDAKSEKNETRTYKTSNFVENGISCGFLDDNDNLKETEQSKELLITDMILTAIETLKIRKQRGFSQRISFFGPWNSSKIDSFFFSFEMWLEISLLIFTLKFVKNG